MGKDPAFLFYSQDFIMGTALMSNAQTGLYIKLLCIQHQHGGLIDDVSFDEMVKDDRIIRSKFVKANGGYYNARLMEEMTKREKKSSNLSANAKKGWENRCKSNANAMPKHMPIENENEIANATNTTKRTTKTTSLNNEEFEILWQIYPNKLGKKAALRHYNATVITPEDRESIHKALDNFIEYCKDKEPKFIQHGSTWFNNWHDWVAYIKPETEKTKISHEQEIMRKVGIRC